MVACARAGASAEERCRWPTVRAHAVAVELLHLQVRLQVSEALVALLARRDEPALVQQQHLRARLEAGSVQAQQAVLAVAV